MTNLEKKKVLIVDDNDDNVLLSGIFLEHLWIKKNNITRAADWFEAIEKTKRELFDLIIMDIRLPKMDGIAATKEIRLQYGKNAPKIIASTASSIFDKSNWDYAEKREIFDDVIETPIPQRYFTEKILAVLGDEDDKKIA